MRSKLSIFAAMALATLLCTVVFGKVEMGAATKYGRATESVISTGTGTASALPPVGSRGRNGLDDIIISEDFEAHANGQLPTGWTQIDVDLGFNTPFFNDESTWRVWSGAGYSGHSGTKFVMNFYNDGAVPNDDWLILPQQNLGGTITLAYWVSSQDPAYLESYQVRVSTTGNQPSDFTDLIQDINDTPNAWTQRTHDLSAYAGAPFWFAFHYDAIDEFVLKIDDLLLEGIQLASFGAITGVVTDDNTFNPIMGATVELVGGLSTTTDAAGLFWFTNVLADTYDLALSHPAYEDEMVLDVAVAANETTTVDFALHHLAIEFHDFAYSGPPVPIPDLDSAFMNLDITEDFVITDLDITVNITHTWDADLHLWLETPWNQRVLLADQAGGSGDNYENCRFDDEAATPIGSGVAPFTGSFQPVEQLVAADGSSTLGQWTLVVYDDEAADVGTINNFTLHVTSEATAVEDDFILHPSSFSLSSYPNPFNATTQFRFDMIRAGHASLVLYNILGEQVARLVDENLDAGSHSISFNAGDLPSGVYLARFTAGSFAQTRKIVLLK